MKKTFKFLSIVGSIASIIGLSLFIYYKYIYIKKIELEVKTINNEELAINPTEQNLKAEYTFNGDTVINLYKIRFIISNTGTKTIIGENQRSDLINDKISIYVDTINKLKILDLKITKSNFPISLNSNSNDFFFKFQQWKVDEFVELTAYFESKIRVSDSIFKIFIIEEREIINGKINYSVYNPTKNLEDKILIDFLPKKMKSFFWWSAIITYSILLLLIIYSLKSEFTKAKDTSSKGIKIATAIFMLIFFLFALSPVLWMIKI